MSRSQKSLNSSIEQKDEVESNSKKLLNRKTKRDNNLPLESDIKSILANEIRCSICLEYEKFSSKSCYKCIVCSSHFHLDCYNLFNFPEEKPDTVTLENINNFTCARCKEEKENNINIPCNLCGEHDGIMKKKDDKYIHHYCYVFFKNSLSNVRNGKCKNCKIKNIPVLKCEYHGCKDKYHIKCALEKGIIFSLADLRDDKRKEVFNEKIHFYCETHNKEMIDNYAQILSASVDSMKDKNKKAPDNNPINELQNNDNDNKDTNSNIIISEEILSSNKEKDNNINLNKNNNNEEINKDNINEENKEKEKKSINSNSENGSDNGSQASDKTPEMNYSLDKKKNNSINGQSPLDSNENDNSKNNNNDNNNNNNDNENNMNVSVSENNSEKNNNNNNENKNKNENENNNNKEDEDETFDIKMDVVEEDKNKSDGKEKKNEDNNNNTNSLSKIDEEEEEDINTRKENQTTDNRSEFQEKTEYKIPEIKYETIDLFENFRKMNENYCFPGSFYKFHGV